MKYFDKTTLQYLEEVCEVCSNSYTKIDHPNFSTEENIRWHFHKLHNFLSEGVEDSVANTIFNLKKILDHNYTTDVNKSLFYLIDGKRFLQLGLYSEAKMAFERSLELSTIPKVKGINYLNIAITYIHKEQYSEAIFFLKNAELIFERLDEPRLKKAIQKNKGVCFLHQKDFETSEQAYKKVLDLETLLGDSLGLAASYMDLANLYYEQYLDDKAIPLFEKSLDLAIAVNDLSFLKDAQYNMAIVYKNAGDHKKAFEHLELSQQLKDTLANSEKIWALAKQEKKYVEEQKNIEIDLLEKDKQLLQQQRNQYLIVAGSIFLILLLLAFQYWNSLKKKRLIETQKKEVDQLNAVKDELLSVLGHDLRSPMQHLMMVFDKVFSAVAKGDQSNINRLLQHGNLAASKTFILLDNLLQWIAQQNNTAYFKKEPIDVRALIKQLELTFQPITKMRDISLKNLVTEQTLVLADRNSLKIILRNLIDNAIKFTDTKGQISISTKESGTEGLAISVKDTGIGMPQKMIDALLQQEATPSEDIIGRRSTGLGLRLCSTFITRNDGKLSIESMEGQGSTFTVILQAA